MRTALKFVSSRIFLNTNKVLGTVSLTCVTFCKHLREARDCDNRLNTKSHPDQGTSDTEPDISTV